MKPLITLLSALLLNFNFCTAQWKQTDGPYGPLAVSSIVAHEKLLLAFSNGLFSKTNLSDRWQLNSSVPYRIFGKKGDSLYVKSFYSGAGILNLKNLNAAPISINIPDGNLIVTDSLLYIGTASDGFLVSNNNGKSWEPKNAGLPMDTILDRGSYYYSKTPIYAMKATKKYLYGGTKKGLYRSHADTVIWTSLTTGLPKANITFIEEFNDTLYVAIAERLYRSADWGDTWSLIHTAATGISSLNFYRGGLYAGTRYSGIDYSADNGVSWSPFNTGLGDSVIYSVCNYDTTLVCGTGSGLYYLKNTSWILNQPGMIGGYINHLDTSRTSLVTNLGDSIHMSDNGENWYTIPTPAIIKYPNLSSGLWQTALMGDTLYISYKYTKPSFPYYSSNIKYTGDKGKNWHILKTFNDYSVTRLKCEKGGLFTYDDDKMFYTNDAGLTWKDLSVYIPYCKSFYNLDVYNSIPFASTCGNTELLKLGTGPKWVLSNKGLPANAFIAGIAHNKDALFAYTSDYTMYVSDKEGDNWVSADKGLSSVKYLQASANKGNLLFIGTDSGLFATNDLGQNWIAINEGLKNISIVSMVIWKDTLYVGTQGNGVWKRSLSDIPVKEVFTDLTEKPMEVFPNPASDYIQVKNAGTNSVYRIMDVTGKEILSGQLDAANKIYLSGIQTGIYILEVQFDNKTGRAKLLLNK